MKITTKDLHLLKRALAILSPYPPEAAFVYRDLRLLIERLEDSPSDLLTIAEQIRRMEDEGGAIPQVPEEWGSTKE